MTVTFYERPEGAKRNRKIASVLLKAGSTLADAGRVLIDYIGKDPEVEAMIVSVKIDR